MNQEEQRRTVAVGLAFALVAAFAYGTTQFLAHKLVTQTAPPLVTASFGMLFGTLILATINRRRLPEAFKASRKAWASIIAVGIVGIGGIVFSFIALSMSPVVVVSPLTAINPLIALLLSHIFLKRLERISLRIVGGALMVVGGAILVIMGDV